MLFTFKTNEKTVSVSYFNITSTRKSVDLISRICTNYVKQFIPFIKLIVFVKLIFQAITYNLKLLLRTMRKYILLYYMLVIFK